jgi:hypothetical protein
MRSETEADRKTNSGESVGTSDQQEIPVDQWKRISPDNEMIRTLKKMALGFSKAVQMELKETEKSLKRATKVYYGR